MIKIQEKPIIIQELIDNVKTPNSGAVVTFSGTVRDHDESIKSGIIALYYEAYNEMALAKIDEIARDAIQKYSIIKVAVIQRTGRVNLGEDSIGIAVSAEHRQDAFKACNYIIDKIKIIPPIWKKEIYAGGESWKSET
ncbi:MAG: molybdenum cofactor biosynthesis protein MoaE [Ferroplasma sp.]